MPSRWPYVVGIATVAINAIGIGLMMPVMPSLPLEIGMPSPPNAAAIGGVLGLVFVATQGGVHVPDVSSVFDVSVQTLDRTYRHHHSDHQKSAIAALERRK